MDTIIYIFLYDSGSYFAQCENEKRTATGRQLLTDLGLKNNKIISRYSLKNAVFTYLIKNQDTTKGIKSFIWINKDQTCTSLYCEKVPDSVFIPLYSTLESYYPGKYPQASLQHLSENYLKHFPLRELKIMRNEIFARYGHAFIKGGVMESYFESQPWYRKNSALYYPLDVTPIEKANIERILKAEDKPADWRFEQKTKP